MPNPQFTKPWHGVPREEIDWNPTVDVDACIGCGTCVTGCSRLVYRYDYGLEKAVVADPLNCMVGCTTCANTCPVNAIGFPPLSSVLDLEHRPDVHHVIEDDLLGRREQLEWHDVLPHPERRIRLTVTRITDVGTRTRLITLSPLDDTDCLCQFIPGQYLLLEIPGTGWLARAYSIGSAPRDDGSIELQIRRAADGRVTGWLFDQLALGDTLVGHSPAGHFTLASRPDTPLLFISKTIRSPRSRRCSSPSWPTSATVPSVWSGAIPTPTTSTTSTRSATGSGATPTCGSSWPSAPDRPLELAGAETITGRVDHAVAGLGAMPGFDAYVAGPSVMIAATLAELDPGGHPPVADPRRQLRRLDLQGKEPR